MLFTSGNAEPEAPDTRLTPELPPSFVLAERREDPPWNGWDVALIVVAFGFTSIFICPLLVVAVLKLTPAWHALPFSQVARELVRDPRLLMISQVLSYAITLLVMHAVVLGRGQTSVWRAVGWRWPGAWIAYFGAGLGLGFLISVFGAGLHDWMPKQRLPIDAMFRDASTAYLMAFVGIFIAPVLEELFFRGFLYPVVARRTGVPVSVVLTAIAFALVHASQLALSWAPLLLVFLAGLVFTIVRARKGSVAASVLLHAGYNATLFISIFLETDHFRHLEKMVR